MRALSISAQTRSAGKRGPCSPEAGPLAAHLIASGANWCLEVISENQITCVATQGTAAMPSAWPTPGTFNPKRFLQCRISVLSRASVSGSVRQRSITHHRSGWQGYINKLTVLLGVNRILQTIQLFVTSRLGGLSWCLNSRRWWSKIRTAP